MTWALEQQHVTDPTARHVLLCLANYAGPDGCGAFPSVATLSRDTGLAERTVRGKLDALEQAGLIRPGNAAIVAAYIERADRRPVCYDLMLSGVRHVHPASTGCSSRQNGVQLTTERGAPAAPNPSINHQVTDPSLAGTVCAAMRRRGVARVNPSHPDLLAALAEGVSPETLLDTVAEFIGRDADCFAYVLTVARKRHARGASTVPTEGADHANRPVRGESLVDRAARRLKAIHDAHPEAFDDAADQDAG